MLLFFWPHSATSKLLKYLLFSSQVILTDTLVPPLQLCTETEPQEVSMFQVMSLAVDLCIYWPHAMASR